MALHLATDPERGRHPEGGKGDISEGRREGLLSLETENGVDGNREAEVRGHIDIYCK